MSKFDYDTFKKNLEKLNDNLNECKNQLNNMKGNNIPKLERISDEKASSKFAVYKKLEKLNEVPQNVSLDYNKLNELELKFSELFKAKAQREIIQKNLDITTNAFKNLNEQENGFHAIVKTIEKIEKNINDNNNSLFNEYAELLESRLKIPRANYMKSACESLNVSLDSLFNTVEKSYAYVVKKRDLSCPIVTNYT